MYSYYKIQRPSTSQAKAWGLDGKIDKGVNACDLGSVRVWKM